MESTINIIDDLINAISILNKLDTYLENLDSKLSECDSLVSDYEHFIENTPIEDIDLKKLYIEMQQNFKRRRIIKDDMALRDNYRNLSGRLNNSVNREFLIQNMKTVQSKLGVKYHNRVLTEEQITQFLNTIGEKKGRGRPKKIKEV